jgi:hypothetical protein
MVDRKDVHCNKNCDPGTGAEVERMERIDAAEPLKSVALRAAFAAQRTGRPF